MKWVIESWHFFKVISIIYLPLYCFSKWLSDAKSYANLKLNKQRIGVNKQIFFFFPFRIYIFFMSNLVFHFFFLFRYFFPLLLFCAYFTLIFFFLLLASSLLLSLCQYCMYFKGLVKYNFEAFSIVSGKLEFRLKCFRTHTESIDKCEIKFPVQRRRCEWKKHDQKDHIQIKYITEEEKKIQQDGICHTNSMYFYSTFFFRFNFEYATPFFTLKHRKNTQSIIYKHLNCENWTNFKHLFGKFHVQSFCWTIQFLQVLSVLLFETLVHIDFHYSFQSLFFFD